MCPNCESRQAHPHCPNRQCNWWQCENNSCRTLWCGETGHSFSPVLTSTSVPATDPANPSIDYPPKHPDYRRR